MSVITKRSLMTFFSDPRDHYSHRVRMVLAEKGVTVDIVEVDPSNKPEDLAEINPYNTVPTLLDRDLVLYESTVIMEYLDERFPHPPLMPVDPVSRARSRLALFRIENDLYGLLPQLDSKSEKRVEAARVALRDNLVASAEVFAAKPFFLSEEFTLVDASIAPILWRLLQFGVKLPREAASVEKYAERLFAREAFQRSLTEQELEMR